MMVCTSVCKSSGPCVCSLVLQRLRHLASFCMLLSCFVCRGIRCICSCNVIQFLLQLSRSLGSQLENGLTSSSRLDSSTVDKMPNFWQDGVCSCMLVAYHGFFFVRTILLGYCHDLVYELPLPGFVLSACAVWIASLTLFNSASFSVSLSIVSWTTSMVAFTCLLVLLRRTRCIVKRVVALSLVTFCLQAMWITLKSRLSE